MKYCQQWFEYLLILLYLYIQNLPRQHKQYHRPHHKNRLHRRRHHHSILLLTLLDQNFQLWQTQNLENLMMRILQKTMSLQIHSIGYCWNQTRYLLQFHHHILQLHSNSTQLLHRHLQLIKCQILNWIMFLINQF